MPNLHQPAQSPSEAVGIRPAGMAALRMETSEGAGSRSVWAVAGHFGGTGGHADWPGREWGVRQPQADETPLSYAEALHLVRGVA